jgi:hypothetical protein
LRARNSGRISRSPQDRNRHQQVAGGVHDPELLRGLKDRLRHLRGHDLPGILEPLRHVVEIAARASGEILGHEALRHGIVQPLGRAPHL